MSSVKAEIVRVLHSLPDPFGIIEVLNAISRSHAFSKEVRQILDELADSKILYSGLAADLHKLGRRRYVWSISTPISTEEDKVSSVIESRLSELPLNFSVMDVKRRLALKGTSSSTITKALTRLESENKVARVAKVTLSFRGKIPMQWTSDSTRIRRVTYPKEQPLELDSESKERLERLLKPFDPIND